MADRCSGDAASERVLAAARRWIGTPYLHGASCRGAGSDCLGLVRGVWREVIGEEPEHPDAYAGNWAEADPRERMHDGLSKHLGPVDVALARPGDVLLFRLRENGPAGHAAILSAGSPTAAAATMIHAWSGHAVRETHLNASWRRRLVAAFRFPTTNDPRSDAR